MQHESSDARNAFSRSLAIQREAASEGFDWPEISGVLDKVREELDELVEAVTRRDTVHARYEFGDLLFTVMNLARFLDADPEKEIDRAAARFTSRYKRLKSILAERKRTVAQTDFDDLNRVWKEVKRSECDEQKRA
ncbi:MAG: hypothetical protein IID08_06360 [Candidatus Hydrogenedentes bacterium]|nr:hypothetical protein [Candidatus Hydrogenedentota bacterium]